MIEILEDSSSEYRVTDSIKKASTDVISVTEFDVTTLGHMLDFMYEGTYNANNPGSTEKLEHDSGPGQGKWLLETLINADKSDILIFGS